MPAKRFRELRADEVRYRADLSPLKIRTSDDISPALSIVGQSDALEALEMGLRIQQPGYNVFLTGMKGTGRFAAVREMIRQAVPECPLLRSRAYVFNFKQHDVPLLVTLPPGTGKAFSQAVERLRDGLRDAVPALLMGDVMTRNRQRLMAKWEREASHLFGGFDQQVQQAGFALVQGAPAEGAVQMADIFPLVKGEPVPIEQIRADPGEAGLAPGEIETLERRRQSLKQELSLLVIRHRQIGNRYRRLIKDSETRKMGEAVTPLFEELRQKFPAATDVIGPWLDGVQEELLDHLEAFRESDPKTPPPPGSPRFEDFLGMIQVNVLGDPEAPAAGGCPVIEENYPTWRNLIGSVEAAGDPPMATFMDIRAGSLLKADGGYILLAARDILTEPRVYEHLKRVLRKGSLEIAPREDGHGMHFGLKPTPIPLQVKVVLVGEPEIYDLLHGSDPDFPKIFKMKVEFDESMPLSPESLQRFLSVMKRIITENRLPVFDRGALEVAVEEGVRTAGQRDKLTTHFSDMADVLREAAHHGGRRGAKRIGREDMERSLDLRRRRTNLIERRMQDLLREGKVLIDVDGERVGQINGLAYFDLGYANFGMPARISATCATGRSGVVNIEREAELSGSIHDKGVLIISGFLASTFAQDKPLALSANIAFEQSYAMVDGDSASLAELLALLSALSGIPLRQDLAVTGSLNQRGGVQPVGGVTEKITGFYRACTILGLTDRQGAVLPAMNAAELHLDHDICAAVKARRFHIHPVSDYREALEILTGRPAKQVLAAADRTLAAYAEVVGRRGAAHSPPGARPI